MKHSSNINIIISRCRVAKQIAPSDLNQDLNLNSDLFIIYGVGPTGNGAGSLLPHNLGPGGNPLLSQGRFNAAADAGGDIPFPTVDLLRAHGIIMLIAWPLLAISGIFFAAWMRPALPNGEWFKVSHRCKANVEGMNAEISQFFL